MPYPAQNSHPFGGLNGLLHNRRKHMRHLRLVQRADLRRHLACMSCMCLSLQFMSCNMLTS